MNTLTKQTYESAKIEMHLLRMSIHTQKSYLGVIYNFLEWIDVPPSKVAKKHFSDFIYKHSFKSRSQQDRYISGLKFLYYKVLGKKVDIPNSKRPKKSKKLPKVLSHPEFIHKLEQIENYKHYMIFSLTYACSLRRSEIINLKLDDIDYNRMNIHIREAKGSKDRYVKLSPKIRMLLGLYIKMYRPKEYLFNGQGSIQYSGSSLYKLAKKYFGCSFHNVRHSSATAIHEALGDIYLLSNHLGHASVDPTQLYVHLNNNSIQKIPSLI